MNTVTKFLYLVLLIGLLVTDGTAQLGRLVQSSNEAVYKYSSSLVAGSKDYVSYASAINFTGELHIQGEASVLNVQLNNVQVGFYNGEFHMNPLPDFEEDANIQRFKRNVNGQTNKAKNKAKLLLKNIQEIEGIQMQFSYVNGKVENLRIIQGYPTWSENILRGIASFLRTEHSNNQGVFQESDINGDCLTTYSRNGDKITKTKDLFRCTGRPDTNHTTLSALLTCSHTFRKGMLESGECTENHLIELVPTVPVNVTVLTTLRRLNTTKATSRIKIANFFSSDLKYDADVPHRKLNERKPIQKRSILNPANTYLGQGFKSILQREDSKAISASEPPSRCGNLNLTLGGFLQPGLDNQIFLFNVGVCNNFQNIFEIMGATSSVRPLDTARDLLPAPASTSFVKLDKSGSPQEVSIDEPLIFEDDEIIIPTSSGMPLTVTVEGASLLSLQITGNLDVVSLLRGNEGNSVSVMPITSKVVRSNILVGSGPLKSGIGFEQSTVAFGEAKRFLVKADGVVRSVPELFQNKIQPIEENKIFTIEETKNQTKRFNIKRLVL